VGENGVEIPAPEGAQDFIDFLYYLSPSTAGNPAQPFYPGLVPGANAIFSTKRAANCNSPPQTQFAKKPCSLL